MCECTIGRTGCLVPSAHRIRSGLYDTHTLSGLNATSFCALVIIDPASVVSSRRATSHVPVCMRCIYPISSAPAFVVASIHCCYCCISRSSSVYRFIITPHIAILASIRIPIPGLLLVPPLVCFTILGGPMSTPTTLVRVPTPKEPSVVSIRIFAMPYHVSSYHRCKFVSFNKSDRCGP
ncbi:hypothetical protein EI94DRAFT_964623 [Lactarius quietus]|nr:hypothetical protein EI94DRAFT_964623 [Lactarius quietus]